MGSSQARNREHRNVRQGSGKKGRRSGPEYLNSLEDNEDTDRPVLIKTKGKKANKQSSSKNNGESRQPNVKQNEKSNVNNKGPSPSEQEIVVKPEPQTSDDQQPNKNFGQCIYSECNLGGTSESSERTIITYRNKYGTYINGYTCCGRCDRAYSKISRYSPQNEENNTLQKSPADEREVV